MKYGYEEGKLSLEITNTTAEDFGKYRAVLSVNDAIFDEIGVILVVNGEKLLKLVFFSYFVSGSRI